ncbi:hypothetical protein, partial [Aquimarina pacifica]|uniref:hypothetical protein n=1 Tax=Aquimarina pacifica TaxID=1296415 RepID=UPI0004709F63
ISMVSYGQEVSNIVPPSPNAASLGQYADVPVSNYTGIPNISIPLHTVKSGDIDLPISLSYHASGIKVAQEASWVGLGWTLNAGGVITRQVRGLDDFGSEGYLRTDRFPPYTEDNLPDLSESNQFNEYYDPLNTGFLDGEPDIYYYNFLGFSGKIIFEKQLEDTIYGVSVAQNNLKFKYTKSTGTWVITDGNGTNYYFGGSTATEKTYNFSDSDDNFLEHVSVSIPSTFGHVNDKQISDTAWYLTKIESAKKDEINFFYKSPSYTKSQVHYTELLYNAMSSELVYSQGPGYISSNVGAPYKLYGGSQQVTKDICLERIAFADGALLFNTEDRIDLDVHSLSDNNAQRLSSIVLFDLNDNQIKKTNFEYSYMGSGGSNNVRLKLETIQESSYTDAGNEVTIPPYEFTYNPTSLPEKTSFNVDYWGFSNGRNNASIWEYAGSVTLNSSYLTNNNAHRTLTESYAKEKIKSLAPNYENNYNGEEVFIRGANREVNFASAQAGILTAIKYPLGGTTTFEYESNEYHSEEEELSEYIPQTVTVYENNEKTFSLDRYTTVHFDFDLTNDSDANLNSNDLEVYLEKDNGNKLIRIKPLNVDDFTTYFKVVLPPGDYTMKAYYPENPEIIISFKASYTKRVYTDNKIGGGLRIKSIETKDIDDVVKKETYSYEVDGISAGRLVSPLNFFYNETLLGTLVNTFSSIVIQYVYAADYIVRSSNSIFPLGNSAQGNPIGYDSVQVSYSDPNNEDLGRTMYTYRNEEEVPVEHFIPNVPNFIHLDNGQLLSKTTYNSDGDIVDELFLEYTENQNEAINSKGVKLYSFHGGYDASGGKPISGVRFYDTFSKWWYLSKETKNVYDTEGNNPVTSITEYDYNNASHKNVTRTTTINSKSETLISNTYYPDDIGNADSLEGGVLTAQELTAIERLSSDGAEYRVAQPIQTETYVDNTLISVQRTNFSTVNQMTLPASVSSAMGSEDVEEKII